VWEALVDAGVRKFKVATPRELEHLGRVAAAKATKLDVLLAFPVVGPTLDVAINVAKRHSENLRCGLLVEDPEGVAEIPSFIE
jgi:hypothetical protein